MNEDAVKKMRSRFIRISFLAFFITMVFIAGLLLTTNYMMNRRIARRTLNYIISNDGYINGAISTDTPEGNEEDSGRDNDYSVDRFLKEIFSDSDLYADDPEFTYSTRYFAVIYDKDQRLKKVITNQIASVTDEEAEKYADTVLSGRKDFGRSGAYYYKRGTTSLGGYIVVYLDCSAMMDNINRIMYLALCLIMVGVVITGIVIRHISGYVVADEIRSIKIQKSFITNASHELKTPLAVIRANTEMEEMLGGENEWTQSTLRQVERMSGLINNLVMISRSDENAMASDAGECDVSKAVAETVKTFVPVAVQEDKTLTGDIPEGIRMLASDAQIRQLVSLLIDNAIKYCDEKGNIVVKLFEKGKYVHLTISNDYAEGKDVDYSRFFERFYREDESHNTDKGGYGIGLSIAQSLVEKYHGSISASWKNGVISFHVSLKPLKLLKQ